MSVVEASFSEVFARALRGEACEVVGVDGPRPLPVGRWTAEADEHDDHLLDHCSGSTLDVGCGPGRLTSALADRGVPALGIDVVAEAVDLTRARGCAAVCGDVFGPVAGAGHWSTVLLADGNIGIGGDPVALLRRVARLVAGEGRVVVETAPPGASVSVTWSRLECAGLRSRPFRWAVVGADALPGLAGSAGLRLVGSHPFGDRWCGVLEPAA